MLEDADRSHILREILEGILQELGSLESSLRSIRDQFIPYLHDATSTAALGHIILQELLLDMTSHIGNAMDEVDQQQQAVQDAKVDLEQIRDDRMREALQRAKLTPGQVNMRILALQKHLKKKREDRDKAWATVIGMRQLRDAVVATVSNLQSMEMKPASFELAKMKQQYMMLYHQKLFCHLHMHLFQTRLQLHTQDVSDRQALRDLLMAYSEAIVGRVCLQAVQTIKMDTGDYENWLHKHSWAGQERDPSHPVPHSACQVAEYMKLGDSMLEVVELDAVNTRWGRVLRSKSDLVDCLLQ
eukprot:Ihof_evm2s281 gene=Ihof_evmTU2s281